jgi:hypothetical protein
MTTESAMAGMVAERSSRRKAARLKMLAAVPLLGFMGYRLATDTTAVDASGWILGLGLAALIMVVSGVGVFTMFDRRLRSLAPLAGPGGWAALCSDPDDLEPWQVLLVDSAGVRTVGRSGVAGRAWSFERIREVTVERFPVALMTRTGVVLYLADDSRAELLLASRKTGNYTVACAEAAANEIRRRLAAFPDRPTPSEAVFK